METKMSAEEIKLFVVEQLSALGIADPSDEYVERLSEKLIIALSSEEGSRSPPFPHTVPARSPNSAVYKTYPMSQVATGSPVTMVAAASVMTPSYSFSHTDVSTSSILTMPSLLNTPPPPVSSSQRKRKVCRMSSSANAHNLETSSVSDVSQDENVRPEYSVDVRPSTATKSFIRPQTSGRTKSDPVKRYHHYRQLWNSCPVPGDNEHKVLRWRMREKMLSNGPNDNQCYVPVGRESLKVNTYVVPTSKKRQDLRWQVRTTMAHKDDVLN